MLKTEKFLVAFVAISLVLKYFSVSGSALLIFLSINLLACFYYVFAFACLNGIGFGQIFRKSSYTSMSVLRIIGSIATGICISTTLIGILFKLLHYEGANELLFSGLAPALVVIVISTLKFFKKKESFYSGVLLRIAVVALTGVLTFLM